MIKRRYQTVTDRHIRALLPACLDDYVAADNPIRAIDAWVNAIDLQKLGFEHTEPTYGVGQPPYDPAILLKLYLYGYQERVHSSRRLERLSGNNLESGMNS